MLKVLMSSRAVIMLLRDASSCCEEKIFLSKQPIVDAYILEVNQPLMNCYLN